MVIWGGLGSLNTGGRYDPVANAWTPTSVVEAPEGRSNHTAVATGDSMIVWGGFDDTSEVNSGGIYGLCSATDGDGDGYSTCDGDCNDGNDDIHPGAVELCNGIDDDCDDAIDEGILPPTGRPNVFVGKVGTVTDLSWAPIAGATGYDMVKGNLGPLRNSGGNFAANTKACVANDLPATTVQDTEVPPPTGGLWFILRAVNCGGDGTYDEEPGGQQGSRDAEIDASPNACP
jgi:hypothetical protein